MKINTTGWYKYLIPSKATWCRMIAGVVLSTIPTIDNLFWDEVFLASAINNKMQWGPLHPHLWMKNTLPSPGYFGSFGWIVAVPTIAVGSASMICPLPLFSEPDSESGFGSLSLILATNDYFERHPSVLCKGILWNSHHFLVFLCLSGVLLCLQLGLVVLILTIFALIPLIRILWEKQNEYRLLIGA